MQCYITLLFGFNILKNNWNNLFFISGYNKCLEKPCDILATCTRVDDSHTCACNTGYTGNGITCTDLDECLNSTDNNCDTSATCLNNVGSYTCTCDGGFTLFGGTECRDIDECKQENICQPENGFCLNLPGGHDCLCQKGYRSIYPFTPFVMLF